MYVHTCIYIYKYACIYYICVQVYKSVNDGVVSVKLYMYIPKNVDTRIEVYVHI